VTKTSSHLVRWAVVGILAYQILATVSCGGSSPKVLTQQHGEEMHTALQHYFDLAEVGWTSFDDPSVLQEVEAGEVFTNNQWLVEYLLSDDHDVIIVDRVAIEYLEVRAYSPRRAVVWVRYTKTDYPASQITRERVGWIVESTLEGTFSFVKEDGKWKVIGSDLQTVCIRHPPTPTPDEASP